MGEGESSGGKGDPDYPRWLAICDRAAVVLCVLEFVAVAGTKRPWRKYGSYQSDAWGEVVLTVVLSGVVFFGLPRVIRWIASAGKPGE